MAERRSSSPTPREMIERHKRFTEKIAAAKLAAGDVEPESVGGGRRPSVLDTLEPIEPLSLPDVARPSVLDTLEPIEPLSAGVDRVPQNSPEATGGGSDVTGPVDITSSDYLEGLATESRHNDSLIKEFANLNAERSKTMIDRAKTRDDIEASKESVAQSIQDLGAEMYFNLESQGLSHDEIIEQIDEFVAGQADTIMAQMEANRLAEYQASSGVMKKLYDKWSLYGEQGLKGQLKKAAVFGAAGAVVATGFGVVGAGLAGAGIAAAGARAAGRGLVRTKLDRVANAAQTGAEQTAGVREQIAEDSNYDDILDIIDKSSEKYRKQNRNRMIGGIAVGASFGALGGLVVDAVSDLTAGHELKIDAAKDMFGKFGEKIANVKDAYFGTPEGLAVDEPVLSDTPEASSTTEPGSGSETGGGGAEPVADAEMTRGEIFDGHQGTRELTPEGKQALLKYVEGYKVKPGDSIWDISRQFLEEQGVNHPTTFELDTSKDDLLPILQKAGYADARGFLSVGDTIKLK